MCEPFTERFDNMLAGWAVTFDIGTKDENDLLLMGKFEEALEEYAQYVIKQARSNLN